MFLNLGKVLNFALWVFILISVVACRKDLNVHVNSVSHPAVVLVVWDGIRLEDIMNSEGSLREDIVPFLKQLSVKPNSFFTTKFYHQGYTYTMAGHLALLTGDHFPIKNDPSGTSPIPTIMHQLIAQKNLSTDKTWFIATKKKICSLSSCSNCDTVNEPRGMCNLYGIWGPMDSRTFQGAVNVLQTYKPQFLLVSFAAPDIIAHAGDYEGYLKAISQADLYTSQLYSLITTIYSDSVMFIITTDHGRHDYDFRGHGDNCSGCKSLFLLVNFPFDNQLTIPPYVDSNTVIVHKDIYCWMSKFMNLLGQSCVE